MFADGHAVALHSSARWLMLNGAGEIAATLRAAATRIEQLAGSPPCPLFRPHAGWRSVPVMHDGHHRDPRADRRYAIDATARLIPALRARGLGFGRLC
jgi:hypothetical protein